jgi:hypothetical protein
MRRDAVKDYTKEAPSSTWGQKDDKVPGMDFF